MKDYGDAMALVRKRHYWFFSKDGSTPGMHACAKEDVKLFTLEDLYF